MMYRNCAAIAIVIAVAGCSSPSLQQISVKTQPQSIVDQTPSFTLSWEKNHPERAYWTALVAKTITQEFDRFDSAKDSTEFCKNYKNITKEQKIFVWSELISAIAKFESDWDPTSRMQEDFSNLDSITGLPVFSEGLLQLSYQDIKWGRNCEFSWADDKLLVPKDPNKTILNPKNNIECGIRILSDQINKRGRITLSSNVYWSVLKIDGKYNKIPEISKMTNSLNFCKV